MLTIHPKPCWHLTTTDGKPWDEDDVGGSAHYDTADEAKAEITSISQRGHALAVVESLTVERFAQPCVTLTCDGDKPDPQTGQPGKCGKGPDDDHWSTVHFPGEDDARSLADVYDFVVDADRTVRCPNCETLRIMLAEDDEDEVAA